MATAVSRRSTHKENGFPLLEAGDTLDQPTFHARYKAMREDVKAELIGGRVYMASPVKAQHGRPHALLIAWLTTYQGETPGTDVVADTTTILGNDSEPQPDAALLIIGGQAKLTSDDYYKGAPEFAAEVGSASESIDLNDKKRDYEKYGVREYLVVAARERRVYWFMRRGKRFVELKPGANGIHKSRQFPGLWLDGEALLAGRTARVLAVLKEGLASVEHAKFVASLQ
jgi:Uma2 family endonuclease